MMSEATSIAIYKMCARSVQNRLQIVHYYHSSSPSSSSSSALSAAAIEESFLNSIDGCTILLDFFDVDFPRTTSIGTKANRGYTQGMAFAGWTHVLATFSVLLSAPPLVDKIAGNHSLRERFRRMLEQVAIFWDSPLCKLLTFETYTGMVSFTNSLSTIQFSNDKQRIEWLLQCTCRIITRPRGIITRGISGVPLLTLYTDHLRLVLLITLKCMYSICQPTQTSVSRFSFLVDTTDLQTYLTTMNTLVSKSTFPAAVRWIISHCQNLKWKKLIF